MSGSALSSFRYKSQITTLVLKYALTAFSSKIYIFLRFKNLKFYKISTKTCKKRQSIVDGLKVNLKLFIYMQNVFKTYICNYKK